MAKEREIAGKFWKALKSDMTMMLGLADVEEGHSQPMTAQVDDDTDVGPIWFFTAKDTDLAQSARAAAPGHCTFRLEGS